MADVDLLVVQQHAIDSLDSSLRSLGGLIMDETIALGAAWVVGSDFAGQNITESGEGIVQCLKIRVQR